MDRSLSDALDDLKRHPGEIDEIVSEYGIDRDLLVRTFERIHGPLADYSPPVINFDAVRAGLLAQAKKVAAREALAYNRTPAGNGEGFRFENEDYVFVAFDGRCPKFAIKAVRVSDAKLFGIHRMHRRSIFKQIGREAKTRENA